MNSKTNAILFLLFLVVLPSKNSAQTILNFSPQAHTMVSYKQLEIIVDFDKPIDTNSVNSKSFAVFGRWTGVCPGNYFFENGNQRIRFVATKSTSAGEWISVALSKQIQSANGSNLTAGFAWNFWTRSEPAAMQLEKREVINVREENEAPIRTYGAYAGDLNGDGFHDFTVPNEDASDIRVFMNDGSGGYHDYETYFLPPGSKPSTNEGADFNNDGFLDFACGNITGGTVSVLFGDGAGKFLEAKTYAVARGTRGLAILDLNGDGAADIVTANRESNNMAKLINKGDGTFSNSTIFDATTDRETACVTADFNEDGIMDIAVGSYNAGFSSQRIGEIVIMTGDGDGGLSISSIISARGDVWMLAVGDMDNDGHVDVISANSLQNQFAFFKGLGDGKLASGELHGVGDFPLAIDAGDIDGDGDLDVVTSNFGSGSWTVYENQGGAIFSNPYTLTTDRAGSCAVLHDRDRDGDLDMTGIDEISDTLVLFENPTTPTQVEGDITISDFRLAQSYPNPFSKARNLGGQPVTIQLTLNRNANVKIDLFNIRGQKIATVADAQMQQGSHSIRFSPANVPAGVYFYRLVSGRVRLTQKLILFP